MEGSPPERDVLLATKLQVPRSRPGLVPRRRLAGRLEEGLNRGLVLVAAPAGYGKSVLLSAWVRGMTEPVAWLSLDGGDNDPVRFWRHVLAALDVVRPGHRRAGGPAGGPAGTAVLRRAGQRVDQRCRGRAGPARRAAGTGRLPPDQLGQPAGVGQVLARSPSAPAARGTGQPLRSAPWPGPVPGAGRAG